MLFNPYFDKEPQGVLMDLFERQNQLNRMLLYWGSRRAVAPPSKGFSPSASCSHTVHVDEESQTVASKADLTDSQVIHQFPPEIYDQVEAVYSSVDPLKRQIMRAKYLERIPDSWVLSRLGVQPIDIIGHISQIKEKLNKRLERLGL